MEMGRVEGQAQGVFFKDPIYSSHPDKIWDGERKDWVMEGDNPHWEICGGLAQGEGSGLVD